MNHGPSTILCLVLLDIEILEANEVLPGTFQRRAYWMPHTVTILTAFRLLNLEHFFHDHRELCHLWHNLEQVDLYQQIPLLLADGDYLKVYIGTNDESGHCATSSNTSHSEVLDHVINDEITPSDAFAMFQTDAVRTDANPILVPLPVAPPADLTMDIPDLPLDDLRTAFATFCSSASNSTQQGVPFETWYVHGLAHPRCSSSRLVSLTEDENTWATTILQPWLTTYDSTQSYRIVMIQPPVQPALHAGHLLILQQEHWRERAVLISTTWHSAHADLHDPRVDQFVPHWIAHHELLQIVGIAESCHRQRFLCLAYHNQVEFDPAVPVLPASGSHFEVHFTPWALIDDTDLMQRSLKQRLVSAKSEHEGVSTCFAGLKLTRIATQPEEDAIDMPSTCSDSESFQFNPRASPFVPQQLLLSSQSVFVQDLHAEWQTLAFSWEDETPSCTIILTWMVDHAWETPHCFRPRPVRLYDDFVNWEDQLTHVWRDYVVDALPREFHIVSPKPPAVDNSIAAHVIIIQRPNEAWVTSLTTSFDSGTTPSSVYQAAITTHEHILLDNLLRVLNFLDSCVGSAARYSCQSWYDRVPLTIGHPIPGRSGYSILLQFRLLASDTHTDTTSLLQRRLEHPVMNSRERLTADAVAQAQQPQVPSVQLSLAECLDPPVFIHLDFAPAIALRHALLSFDLGTIYPWASVVKWHEATQNSLDAIPDWHGEQIQGISFFTDGSAARFADQRRAAAAVVRILHTSAGDRFGGFRCFDTSPNGFAPQAEAAAITTAVLWALHRCLTILLTIMLKSSMSTTTACLLVKLRRVIGECKPMHHSKRPLALWCTG